MDCHGKVFGNRIASDCTEESRRYRVWSVRRYADTNEAICASRQSLNISLQPFHSPLGFRGQEPKDLLVDNSAKSHCFHAVERSPGLAGIGEGSDAGSCGL